MTRSALMALLALLLAPMASGQLLGFENGGDGGDTGAEEEESVREVYECLAMDCRALAAQLGGGYVSDPMADLANRGARRHRGGWLAGGVAPYMPMGPRWEIGQGLRPFRPDGLENVVGIVEQNAILLQGTPDAVDEAIEFLELIDKPAPMVRIELQAISTPEVFDHGSSLQWRALGPNASMGGRVGSLGSGNGLSFALGDIGFAFDQFTRQSRGYEDETISVTTISGSPAYMGVRNTEPNFIPVRGYDRFGNVMTTYDVIYVTTETSLLVLPRVNRDDSVTMFLSPHFSRQVGSTGPPGGSGFPIIETTGTESLVRVANGQTIAIGGLRRLRVDRQWQGGAIDEGMIPQVRRMVTVENVTLFVTPYVMRPEADIFDDIRM